VVGRENTDTADTRLVAKFQIFTLGVTEC